MKRLFWIAIAIVSASASADADNQLSDPAGISAMAGGGLIGFTDSDTRDVTQDGGTWEVRIAYSTRTRFTVEGAYVGSLQSLDMPDGDARLIGTTFETALRLNILRGSIQPFAFVGAGWTHYNVSNADSTLDIAEHDDLWSFPLGLGVGYRWRKLVFDLRGTVRATSGAALMASGMDTWSVTLKVGFEL